MSQETEFTLAYNRGYTDGLAMGMETQRFKDLTDEEIALTWDEFNALQSPKDIKDFARAVLRKAQEK